MADEFVRREHFDEHAQRMDERFVHLEDTVNQRFLAVREANGAGCGAHAGKTLRTSTSGSTT